MKDSYCLLRKGWEGLAAEWRLVRKIACDLEDGTPGRPDPTRARSGRDTPKTS